MLIHTATEQLQAHSHQQLQLQHWQHLTLLGSHFVEDVVLLLHDRVPVCCAGHIHKDLQQHRSYISSGPWSVSEIPQHHLTQYFHHTRQTNSALCALPSLCHQIKIQPRIPILTDPGGRVQPEEILLCIWLSLSSCSAYQAMQSYTITLLSSSETGRN